MPTTISEPAAAGPTREDIRARAAAMGFDAVGFVEADALGETLGARLAAFLDDKAHGDMTWLAEHAAARRHPQALWPAVQTVVALGVNYGPSEDPLDVLAARESGAISVYARGRDYHDIVKKRLKDFGRWLGAALGCEIKVFVDTAPVLEKPVAALAGLGWQGKHTNLVSRDYGSWLFLGEVFVAAPLRGEEPHDDRCGTCRRCLDACPTDAFPAPYRLDARRCISYLTIEHKGHIDRSLRPLMGNRIYGCDDCLAVCPWNRFAQQARESGLQAREELNAPPLATLAELDDAAFRALFRKSPVKRTGRDRFVRNVMIAIGNSGAPELADAATRRLDDASPLVRAMAVWALGRLLAEDAFLALKVRYVPRERDRDVAAEWALGGTP